MCVAHQYTHIHTHTRVHAHIQHEGSNTQAVERKYLIALVATSTQSPRLLDNS